MATLTELRNQLTATQADFRDKQDRGVSISAEEMERAETLLKDLFDAERVDAITRQVEEEAERHEEAMNVVREANQATRTAGEPSQEERFQQALRNASAPEWRSEGEVDGTTVPKMTINLRAANTFRDALQAGVSGDEIVRAAERGQSLLVRRNGDVVERSVNVGTNAQGKFLVPTTLAMEMIRQLWNVPSVRQAGCRILRTPDGREWNLTITDFDPTSEVDESTLANNLTGESAAYNEFQPKWKRITLNAYKTTATVPITKEAIQDTQFDLGSEVGMLIGDIIAARESFLTMVGNGTSMPQGCRTGIAAAQATDNADKDALTYKDVDKLIREFKGKRAGYRAGMRIMMALEYMDEILTTVDSNFGPLFGFMQQDFMQTSYRRIPVVDSIWLQDIGTSDNRVAIAGNFARGFVIREVQALDIMFNPYIRMGNGEVVYYADYRFDSEMLDPRALQALDCA